jgi:hypothetical protein
MTLSLDFETTNGGLVPELSGECAVLAGKTLQPA